MNNISSIINDYSDITEEPNITQYNPLIINDLLDLNLEYLLNKEQYNKYLNDKIPFNNKRIKKDKKFYKRRVFELTKQLLNKENPDRITSQVLTTFEKYFNESIEYFKILDKTDIIQEEYLGCNIDEVQDLESLYNQDCCGNWNNSDCDILLTTRCFEIPKNGTLDKFVTVKNIKIKKEIIPLKKEINLKDPILKNKGCKNVQINGPKETNITIKYENEKISVKDNKKENKNKDKNKETKTK